MIECSKLGSETTKKNSKILSVGNKFNVSFEIHVLEVVM